MRMRILIMRIKILMMRMRLKKYYFQNYTEYYRLKLIFEAFLDKSYTNSVSNCNNYCNNL